MTPVLALLALQLIRGREAVDPATYTSRSGAFELRVEASRVDGGGEGSYRMLRSGAEAWSGVRDFTLLDARVTEDGRVVGYSLTEGQRKPGHLRVIVLAPDGAVLLDERHAREHSRFLHTDPNPDPLDLVLVPSADAGILRVADPDVNRGLESWWVYRLSTGERLEAALPAERLDQDDDPRAWIQGAAALEPQGLVLAFGYARHGPGLGDLDEQWFALLEPAGSVVWSLEDEGAFGAELGGVSRYDLLGRERERGLLPAPVGADMRLWRVAEGAAVDYRVERDPDAEHGWRVVEVARAADEGVPEPLLPVEPPEPLDLEHLATISLERGAEAANQELGPVAAWAFDEAGGLRLVRRIQRRSFEQLRVDRKGASVGSTAFAPLPVELEGPILWTYLGGERWLVTVSPYGNGVYASAFFADGASGALHRLTRFNCPAVDAIAAAPDGGFAVLATHHFEYTMSEVMIAFGPDGAERWRVGEGYSDPKDTTALFSPEDLTVMSDGTVAVVSTIRNSLQFFDAGGDFLRFVDLGAAWGREPRYPSGVRCAPLGGLLVYDSGGSLPSLVVESDGTIRTAFAPRRADGHVEPRLADQARFAPDGGLWTCDEHRFYRLDAAGAEVEALGAAPTVGVVHDPGASAVDDLGRVLIQDHRNGALHVYASDGSKLAVCAPEPTDFERVSSLARIVAGPDGGFVVNTDRGHVRFDARGERLDLLEQRGAVDYLTGSDLSFAFRGGRGAVELRDGGELVARVQHLPSRRWITDPEDVFAFADGSFLILADGEVGEFDAGGAPRASHPLPPFASRFLDTLSASERWILVSGFENEACLIDRESGAAHLIAHPSAADQKGTYAIGLAPRGGEILVVDAGALVLHRYALP